MKIGNIEITLNNRIRQAIRATQNEVFNIIQKHIQMYYEEYTPKKYERTYKFRNEGIIKTNIIKSGNNLCCTVEVNPDFLEYLYPGGEDEEAYATGAKVILWANNKNHGGIYDGDFGRFWSDAIKELGGRQGITEIFKKNCKQYGISVR